MTEAINDKRETTSFLNNLVDLIDSFELEESKMGFPEGKTAVQLLKEINR